MSLNFVTDSDLSILECETFSHPYFTRLSVRKSLALSKLKDLNRPRNSSSVSNKYFSEDYFPDLSCSCTVETDFGKELTVKTRRSSLFLEDNDQSNELSLNKKRVHFHSIREIKMDTCTTASRNQRYPKSLPIFIALGALIIIAVPIAKLLGSVRRDMAVIHDEMSCLKKQVNYVEVESTSCPKDAAPKSKLSKACSEAVKSIVKEELTTFDADKTGRTDFALESAGGAIIKTMNTESYGNTGHSFFGFTLCEGINGPRAMIRAGNALGECWAFKGSKGTAVVKLLGKVLIDSVSLEHVSNTLSPTGNSATAPRDFSVYGLEKPDSTDSKERKLLGKFVYNASYGERIQIFPIKQCPSGRQSYEYVEFHVDSNHGSEEFTCVYRFRVHGKLEPPTCK